MPKALPLIIIKMKGDPNRRLVVVAIPDRAPGSKASIHAEEIVGQFLVSDEELGGRTGTLEDMPVDGFSRGKDFTNFLHESIARHGSSLLGAQASAVGRDNAYVYIIDGRTPTPQGDVPVEDIIGAFRVASGKIVPDSYQRFEAHRLYTERGFFQLDPMLRMLVLKDLQDRIEAESK